MAAAQGRVTKKAEVGGPAQAHRFEHYRVYFGMATLGHLKWNLELTRRNCSFDSFSSVLLESYIYVDGTWYLFMLLSSALFIDKFGRYDAGCEGLFA